MRYIEKLHIMMGLPGSGKSSLADEIKKADDRNIYVIHADEEREKMCVWGDRYEIRDYVRQGMDNWRGQTQVVVDGLVLTNDHIFNVAAFFLEYAYGILEVVVHRFDEDRETCINNDGGRRERKSTRTIMGAQYEEVDIETLNKRLLVYGAKNVQVAEVICHKVELKPDWYRFFKDQVDIWGDGKLRSQSWSLGGMHGSCYGGKSYSDGEEPYEFTELDELLDEKCPDLAYKHFRAIRTECIKTEEREESEYYGGYTRYMN